MAPALDALGDDFDELIDDHHAVGPRRRGRPRLPRRRERPHRRVSRRHHRSERVGVQPHWSDAPAGWGPSGASLADPIARRTQGGSDARDPPPVLGRRRRRRRPHPRTVRPLGDLPRARSTATVRCGSSRTRTASTQLEIGGQPSTMSRRGFPSTLAAMGRPDLDRDGQGPGGHLRQPRTRRRHRRQGAAEAARRRAHRRRRHLHHDRAPVGGRAGGRRAVAGLHAGLQPVDLRLVLATAEAA